MGSTQIRGHQILDHDITFDDIADGGVRGATGNGGTQREIASGTVSDVDLRNGAVSALKLLTTDDFTMNTLALAMGTAGAPALRFTGNTTTGIFSSAANIINITTNGIEALRVDTVGQKNLDGSNASPSISFLSDTSLGFFRVSSGTLGVTVSGAETLRINSTGLDFKQNQALQLVVEVRSTNPSSPLEGQIWYRSDLHQWFGYNGTSNVVLG